MAVRTTPGIDKQAGSNVNPLYKAARTVTGYVGNVGKEFKETARAYSDTINAQMDTRSYPPERRAELSNKADIASAKTDKQYGQLAGAILQGRRYDSKGVRK
jgi:hypothetical protein